MTKNRNWTQEEIEYLEDNYGTVKIKTISKKLNRSASAITNKVNRMNLGRWYTRQDGITMGEFSKATTIAHGTLKNWTELYEMPFRKKSIRQSDFYIIKLEDFWEWAETHKQMVEWDKIERLAIGPEPHWVAEARKAKVIECDCSQKKIPWSKADDEKLRWMLKQYRYTYADISEEIGRTHGAVKRRALDLGIMMRPLPVAKREYTDEEIAEILRLYEIGYGFKFIAKKLKRSEAGVRGKLERMGYSFSNRVLVKSEVTG